MCSAGEYLLPARHAQGSLPGHLSSKACLRSCRERQFFCLDFHICCLFSTLHICFCQESKNHRLSSDLELAGKKQSSNQTGRGEGFPSLWGRVAEACGTQHLPLPSLGSENKAWAAGSRSPGFSGSIKASPYGSVTVYWVVIMHCVLC